MKDNADSYKVLIDNMDEGVALFKVVPSNKKHIYDFELLKMNLAFKEITNLDNEIYLGKNLSFLLKRIDKSFIDWVEIFNSTFKTKNETSFSFYSSHLNRNITAIVLVPQENYIALLLKDISEKANAVSRLKESKRKFTTLLENLPGMVYRCEIDKVWRIKFISDSSKKILGISPDELINKQGVTYFDLILPEFREKVDNHWQTCLVNKEIFLDEYQMKTADGRIIWVMEQGQGIFSSDGKLEAREGYITDITQLKEKQNSILKLQKAFDSSLEAIFITDTEGIITSINPAFTKLYGYTESEVINKVTPRILKSGRHHHSEYDDFWSKLINNKVIERELINKTKAGKIVTVTASANAILDNEDKIIGFLAVQRDITDRKRTENIQKAIYKISESVHSDTDINSLYKEIHDSITILMPSKNFYIALYNNETNLVSFPYFMDEIDTQPEPGPIGKGLTDYVFKTGKPLLINKEQDLELRKQGLVDLVGEPQEIWLGVPLKTNDEVIGVMVVQDYKDPFAYDEKDKEVLVFIAEQVTMAIKQKRIEEELDFQRDLLQNLLDNIPDNIYFKDKNSRFILTNKSTSGRFGLTTSQIIGKSDMELFSNEHSRETWKDEQEIIKTGKPLINKEEKETWEDGRITWASTTKMPMLSREGNIIGTFGISRDITFTKETEVKLKKYAEELKELNINKDKFLSILAHDLRGPFHPLLALSELLATDTENLSKEQIIEFSRNIHKLLINQYELLENLLSWSKIQSGKIEPQPIILNLEETIFKAFTTLYGNAAKKNIKLSNLIPRGTMIKADQNMVNSILHNLITNAIKFTNQGGEIIISCNQIENFYFIKVQDNGVGIREENLQKLFKISEQVTTLGTDKEKGTGLGLLLVKEMIEKHGGSISVKSKPGEGSSFIFSLPKAE
jgi:PAS domain S-box-containing protein